MGNGQFFMVFYQNLLMQLKQIRRNIMLIAIPVIVFFFVYLFFSFNEVTSDFVSPIKLSIIDLDDTTYSDMLVESFRNDEYFSKFVEIITGDNETLRKKFDDSEIDVLIVVPLGFVENLSYFEEMPLQVLINYDDPVKAILFKNVVVGYEKYIRSVETGVVLLRDELINQEFEDDIRYAYQDRVMINLILASLARNSYYDYHEIVNVPTTIAVKYYFIAIMVMFMMYLSIFSAINLIREKQNMCLRRLRITELSLFLYLMAKSLANTVYMFMIVLVWYGLYALFYGAVSGSTTFLLLMFVLICIFFDVALSLFFTIFFDSEEPIVLLSSIFVFMNAVLGGSIIPIHNMSFVIQRIAKFTPNYWMIKGFLFLDSNYKTEEILVVGLILILVSVMLLVITSHKYKRKEA